jgi:3,4-dihydroxy 2-butanone 4-phosphate synthase/GTP cyclohydrolase II
VLGDDSTGKAGELARAMGMIAEHGCGVVVLIREPNRTSLSERVQAQRVTGEHRGGPLRDYGVGAQILLDLGVRDMILLSNTERTIIGLEGYGLNVIERRSIPAA